jgi:hypothetical protein
MKVKEGDRVRIVSRPQTDEDIKSGLYYPHYAGLVATVDRVYEKEVCLKIDLDSLPEDAAKRHKEIQESIKKKWLNGLSGEARNRLTPQEKQFEITYTVLVAPGDLEPAKELPGSAVPKAKAEPESDEAHALTSKDLDSAEEEFLKEREKAIKG